MFSEISLQKGTPIGVGILVWAVVVVGVWAVVVVVV
jgi:hypothetical protein